MEGLGKATRVGAPWDPFSFHQDSTVLSPFWVGSLSVLGEGPMTSAAAPDVRKPNCPQQDEPSLPT